MENTKEIQSTTPRKGDVIELQRDVFFTPAGLYRFEKVSGPIAELSLGRQRFGIPKEALRFCATSDKVLDEDEIKRGLTRANLSAGFATSSAS